jgi:hypothetical protein
MPIPFAELSSENPGVVWNLQLHFWRNAVEHFRAIQEAWDDYEAREVIFEVDACMVIVLAGTSVAQLLGQQYDGPGMPAPRRLFQGKISGVDLSSLGFPSDLPARFEDLLDTYDAIRHFGEPKHEKIRAITEQKLCDLLNTARQVWRLIAHVGGYSPMPNEDEFSYEFRLP